MFPKRITTALTLGLALTLPLAAPADEWIKDKHYVEVSPPLPTLTEEAPEKTEVVELFWYGCRHCFDFEEKLEPWLEGNPENIEFIRVPAVFSRGWAFHARVFYTAEALGVLDKVHRPIFDTQHLTLTKVNTEADAAAVFKKYADIDEATFTEAFNSFDVDAKVRRAARLSRDSKIRGVPSIIINGNVRTSEAQAGSFENMLKLAEDFAAK